MGVHPANGTATIARQREVVLERDLCPVCTIEPRLADGFVCGIGGCPNKTIKIKKPLREWLAAKEVKMSAQRLYVANLPYSADEDQLRWTFESNGFRLSDATIVRHPDGGTSRGFGFVEVKDPAHGRGCDPRDERRRAGWQSDNGRGGEST